MKTFFLFVTTLSLFACATASAETPAEQLGWKLAVHSYTFQKFSIFHDVELVTNQKPSHF